MSDIPKEHSLLKIDYEYEAATAIKALLETKHLYQSLVFGEELRKKIQAEDFKGVIDKSKSRVSQASDILIGDWKLITEKQPSEGADPIYTGPPLGLSSIRIVVPRIKVTCSKCKTENAPHIPFGSHHDRPNWSENGKRASHTVPTQQVFTVKYVCQSCDQDQNSFVCFLITRKGEKLTLSGRSEMEEVTVPKSIPAEEAKLLSNALITNRASMPLAGIFYLRAFVEQYLRRITGISETTTPGDVLAEEYHKLLPDEFPSKFKCMKDVYRDLSGKIHTANPCQKTFDQCHDVLLKHFEQLKLMPIASEFE